MNIDLTALISGNLTLLSFLVIGLGCVLAKLRIGTIELGSTAGVLLAGLLFGHLGFGGESNLGTIGFTLFIFSVGLQAGPRFFSVFAADGTKYIALAAVVAVTAVTATLLLSGFMDFDYGINAGLLAGALTSTPTLAGAQDAIDKGLATLPAGLSAAEASRNLSVGYAITYLFGTIGLILFVRLFPAMLRIDLPDEAQRLARERGLDEGTDAGSIGRSLPVIRAYTVSAATSDAVGVSLRDLRARSQHPVVAQRIRRGDQLLDPEPDTVLQEGDVISVIGSLDAHLAAQDRVGAEVLDAALIGYQLDQREIVVIDPAAVGRTIEDLDLPGEFGCFPHGLVRAQITMPLNDHLVLERGDRLTVTGERSQLSAAAERLGYIEQEVEETDLLTFSFGIVGGLLLGTILVKVGQLSIGLGSAGGLLLTGIVIGFLRNIHPTFGGVPAPARWAFMELGLLFFMAGVGLRAGGGIVDALSQVGPALVLCGMVVTLTPVIVGYLFGRYVLQLNPALLLGSLTGAMTSTPSLGVVTAAARSSVPALGYAGTYTFANVFLTFAGTAIMSL